ncbi:MAG: hypothetical protein CVU43_08530 [Chloroflexi bacterium HGW-Chloroflexi-5]|jgi:hypothetical protein|nr:MAG: hypothetical protein CVU43_08530 [Chloroflexi bacterium HGW-Chloroflexi-5]
MRNKWWAKLLRIVGIVLMSLTAAFTLMGGAGTSCVALNPTGFGGKFAGIASFQWLWILFVLIGVAAGILGVRAVVLLIKGSKKAYRAAIIALLLGTILNAIHMVASRSLRGSSMPVDGVLYMNILTFLVFLLFRIPGIWKSVNFEKPVENEQTGKKAAVFSLVIVGVLTLTIQFVMAPTHTIDGINYANVWHVVMSIIGSVLILSGILTNIVKRFTPIDVKTLWAVK